MKKFLSFAVAMIVAISSLPVYADPGEDRNVSAPISITVDNRDGDGFKDTSASNPRVVAQNATFDAKAVIDMSQVKTQWNDYIAQGLSMLQVGDPSATRQTVLDSCDLSGSGFVVEVDVPTTVTNNAQYTHEWNNNVKALFEEESATYNAQTKKYSINMSVKASNSELDAYFNTPGGMPVLELKFNSKIFTGTTLTKIEAKFTGTISLAITGLGNFTAEEIKVEETDNAYIVNQWPLPTPTPGGNGGGGGGGGPIRPTPTPTPTPSTTPDATDAPGYPDEVATSVEPQLGGTSSGAKLNYVDHYAYIIGYDEEDGTEVVRPENNITRAEVATIFYRLLTDESRNQFRTQENDFTDVNDGDWFNNNVSTVAAAGVVNGYDDGSFGPNKFITRAEFAAIASRFTSLVHDGDAIFNDTEGHWAEDAINNAAITGWVNGYDDGSYEPEAYITRAEAITLINRVLYRFVREKDMHEDMKDWSDNTEDKWYYEAVQEATNSHNYDRKDIGYYEEHTAIEDPYDWESHEK